MIRAGIFAMLAACDLGIGSDPNNVPVAPCLAGLVRTDPGLGCHAVAAPIAIDGATADWASVPAATVAPGCTDAPCPREIRVAAGGAQALGASLFVMVAFAAPPPRADPSLRVALMLEASALQPGSGGRDRIVAGAAGVGYEKNGFAVASAPPLPYRFAWTADGFEAEIDGAWLTFQGAATVAVTVERNRGAGWMPVAPSAPLLVCWDWLTSLGAHACEVPLP